MNRNPSNALELVQIRKSFNKEGNLFYDFSLSIQAGEVVAVVGSSGVGKTTLLNMCALIENVEQGVVKIAGHSMTPAQIGLAPISYIFQRDALLPWRTVLENTLLGAVCQRKTSPQIRAKAIDYLHQVGLQGYENVYPSTLSGGQKQRVALAQNLLLAPRILLLDEPFAHLDFQTKLMMEDLLLKILYKQSLEAEPLTVLLVTHDIEEALVLADRVIVIGRQANNPTAITLDLKVEIARNSRDPVKTRESEIVNKAFGQIWNTIKQYVGGLT